MFSEFTFRGEGGGSAQKDQRFTFFLDIELWTLSLINNEIDEIIPFMFTDNMFTKQLLSRMFTWPDSFRHFSDTNTVLALHWLTYQMVVH